MNKRVVVTGLGLISPVGIGTEATWRALEGRRHRTHPSSTPGFCQPIAGEVKDFDPQKYVEKKEVKKMDLFIQYAIVAAEIAMRRRLTITPTCARVGVIIGSGIGGFATIEASTRPARRGPRRISPFFVPQIIINLAPGQVSIRFGAKGPN